MSTGLFKGRKCFRVSRLNSGLLILFFLLTGAAHAFAAMTIDTESYPFGEVGKWYYKVPAATGGTTPYVWSIVDGTIPDGLGFDAATGRIWQYPSKVGVYDFTLQVQDATGLTADRSFAITIYDPLSIPNLTTTYNVLEVGSGYDLHMTPAGGLPPYSWTITSGALPEGLTFDAASGHFTGSLDTKGYFQFQFQLSDAKGSSLYRTMTFYVVDPLVITLPYSEALPTGLTGVSYGPNSSGFVKGLGGAGCTTYDWSISDGSLPSGLTLEPWTSGGPCGMAVITGIPTETGLFDFTVQLTDGYATTERDFSVYINYAPPTFGYETDYLKFLIADQSNDIPSNAKGGIPPYAFTVSAGSLPVGLAMDPETGSLTGAAAAPGTAMFSAELLDSESTPYALVYPATIYAGNADDVWKEACGTYNSIRDIVSDPSGNVYVVGLSRTIKLNPQGTIIGTFDQVKGTYMTLDQGGNIYTVNPAVNDFTINKYTSSGSLVWTRTYASPYRDTPKSIGVDANGNVYVVGSRYDMNIYSEVDISITKYDYSGNLVWDQVYDNYGRDLVSGAHVDKNGNIYIFASEYGSYVTKFDTLGNLQWKHKSDNYSYYYSGATDENLNIYVTSNDGVTKLDQYGNLIWKNNFSFGNYIGYSKTAVDASGNIYFSAVSRVGSGYMGNTMISAAFDNNGKRLAMRSYFDGDYLNDNYWGGRIAVDGKGHMYILASSRTYRSDFVIKYQMKPVITSPVLPSGTTGIAYSRAVPTASGLPPYSWALFEGTLPPGLLLNAASGVIAGVPSGTGDFSFTVQVTDANGASSTTPLKLIVADTICTDVDQDGFNVDGGSCGAMDCNDTDSAINPWAAEVPYNGIDENCNGLTDDDDIDGDGYSKVYDCIDTQPSIHPGAVEVPYNGVDENCNGAADDDDLDGDGYGILSVTNGGDCDDRSAELNPGSEEVPYNAIDENCNGMADDDDLDQDGYGIADDCNDADPAINPGASEIPYNGIDENCNDMTDDDDVDGDGYLLADDCNDNAPAIHPGAAETPYNGVDENCNGMTDDTDYDGDGYDYTDECNDDDATIYPGAAETKHDGIDQDCNGYDLTLEIIVADYDSRGMLLTVKATSALGAAANLEVAGYGPMIWKDKQQVWMYDVVGDNPGSVLVIGVEGSETASVTVQ